MLDGSQIPLPSRQPPPSSAGDQLYGLQRARQPRRTSMSIDSDIVGQLTACDSARARSRARARRNPHQRAHLRRRQRSDDFRMSAATVRMNEHHNVQQRRARCLRASCSLLKSDRSIAAAIAWGYPRRHVQVGAGVLLSEFSTCFMRDFVGTAARNRSAGVGLSGANERVSPLELGPRLCAKLRGAVSKRRQRRDVDLQALSRARARISCLLRVDQFVRARHGVTAADDDCRECFRAPRTYSRPG